MHHVVNAALHNTFAVLGQKLLDRFVKGRNMGPHVVEGDSPPGINQVCGIGHASIHLMNSSAKIVRGDVPRDPLFFSISLGVAHFGVEIGVRRHIRPGMILPDHHINEVNAISETGIEFLERPN